MIRCEACPFKSTNADHFHWVDLEPPQWGHPAEGLLVCSECYKTYQKPLDNIQNTSTMVSRKDG